MDTQANIDKCVQSQSANDGMFIFLDFRFWRIAAHAFRMQYSAVEKNACGQNEKKKKSKPNEWTFDLTTAFDLEERNSISEFNWLRVRN